MMIHEYPRATSFERKDKIPVNQDDFTKLIAIEKIADDISKRLKNADK